MKEEIPVLHAKLKRYERKSKQKSKDGKKEVSRRYMIPVRKNKIEGTKFQDVEDIVIMSKEDFENELQRSKILDLSHQKIKQSLNDKKLEIRDLTEQINRKYIQEKDIKQLELKLENIIHEYETEIKTLSDKLDNLDEQNKELKSELRSLRDLRVLEKESFKIKLHEHELNAEECNKLKKSHELLWDVVQEKEKRIKELENKGLVNNIFGKIRK